MQEVVHKGVTSRLVWLHLCRDGQVHACVWPEGRLETHFHSHLIKYPPELREVMQAQRAAGAELPLSWPHPSPLTQWSSCLPSPGLHSLQETMSPWLHMHLAPLVGGPGLCTWTPRWCGHLHPITSPFSQPIMYSTHSTQCFFSIHHVLSTVPRL